MRFAHLLRLPLMLVLVLASPIYAQNILPEHRYLMSRNVDFYGADLTNLFDTSREACARACSAQDACVAFTFNTRNNACFPKSAITDLQPYEGAVSMRKVRTDPSVLAAAAQRRAAVSFLSDQDIASAASLVSTNARRFPFDAGSLADLASMTALRLPAKPRTAVPIAGSPGRKNGSSLTRPSFINP